MTLDGYKKIIVLSICSGESVVMFFSKSCEYAIKVMIYLGQNNQVGRLTGVKEIASQIKSPEAFTAKILQQLVRHNLLDSVRGPKGGFQMKQTKKTVTLSDVVVAIDGDGMLKNCVLGLDVCSKEHPCAIHHQFVALRNQFTNVLEDTSVVDVVNHLSNMKITN